MIYIDFRVGSKELATLIEPSILVELKSGDAMFEGNGPKGKLQIGIERKTINDLINSIQDGRLSGYQIPKMLECYQRVYLIVEGIYRGNPRTGGLEQLQGKQWRYVSRGERKFSHEALWQYLSTLEEIAGIVIRNTNSLYMTAAQIMYLYHWWSKPFLAHRSLKRIYKRSMGYFHFHKPSLLRLFAFDLPHIDHDKSEIVEARFKTVDSMIAASEKEWAEIPGIGKIIAKEIWNKLHKE